ncbi:fungal-specific transcription factor domain-containing protein [Hyaloscypha sp. PMI_1271]|nr:fungal-specific transcription factor domain-containing protein [Hyaloscypha sp. PMI_1271]
MSDSKQPPQPSPSTLGRMACSFCRRRKLKCDRRTPCESCQKFGFDCKYAAGISSGSSRPDLKSSRVRQLEDRLGRVEHLLHSKNKRDTGTTPTNSTGKDAAFEWDSDDASLDSGAIRMLEEKYFEFVHPVINIIHPARYAERMRDPDTRPPIYLRQAMWALAATTTDLYSDRCEALYQSSRRHLEEDELKNPGMEAINLAPAQTWILIAMYELNHGYFHRAWMSTSRSVRLVQMMRLHRLDGVTQVMDPTLRFVQAPPDLTDAEERRRIFWVTYIMDRSSCISMGFPALIDERDIRTLLPVSNAAFENSTKERCLFLSDALTTQTSNDLSAFAAQIVIVSLCGSKLAELQRYDPTAAPLESAGSIWLQPQRLGGALTTEFRVPEHLSVPFTPLDPITAFLNMSAFGCTISVHRAARAQLGQDSVSEVILTQSRKLCVEAASKIVMIMKVTSHWNILSFNPWTSYTLYLACVGFANAWLEERDPALEAPLSFLLESLRAFKKTSALATIMLSDINIEFPSLLGQLDKQLAESLSDDFLAFSGTCAPVQIGSRERSTASDFSVDPDFTNGTTDMLNLEEFDMPQESPDAWDLNLYGLSPFPFGGRL